MIDKIDIGSMTKKRTCGSIRSGVERLSRRICDEGKWNGAMQRRIAERLLCGLMTYVLRCEDEERHRLSFIYDLLANISAFLGDMEIDSEDDWPDWDSGLTWTKQMIFRCANSIELLHEDMGMTMEDERSVELKKGWCDLIHSAGYRDDILEKVADGLEQALDSYLSKQETDSTYGGELD